MVAEYILYTLCTIMIGITVLLFMMNHEYKKTLRRRSQNRTKF